MQALFGGGNKEARPSYCPVFPFRHSCEKICLLNNGSCGQGGGGGNPFAKLGDMKNLMVRSSCVQP